MTVQMIGGEMLHWSDLSGTHGPRPLSAALAAPLLAGLPGRALVAGPHDPAGLPAGATVLVRGVADAEALAGRGVSVLCGSLEKLAAEPAFDTVVALDGLGRLCTPEAPDLSWEETLGLLLAVLRPGGRLLLGVPNDFGLDRLVALPPSPADTDWVTPDGPVTSADLHPRLAAAGFPVVREYAAYPGALLGAEVLADPGLRGFLGATLTAAAPAEGRLADPGRLIAGALRHGLAAQLAPGWILLAGEIAAGPAAVLPTGAVRLDGGAWFQGDGTPIPAGRTLADLILAACGRRALPAVRDLLTTWQESPAAGVPADQVVVDAAGGCHGLAAPGTPVAALRSLAALLIGGGYAHLWPSPADEAELTALLAGMTGRELDPHAVPAGPARPEAGSLRELRVERDRLEQELADARAKHEFYERTVASRDAELKRVRQVNALLSATVPGRAANTVVDGLKAGRRAVRAVVKRTRS
jgi:SAM-dependent methyltransferase